ncbi:MAG: hypothetical protein ABEH59_00525 [Halobacteriales archaeon]
MAEPPELWTFLIANLFVFAFGATLTTLSYYAYRTNDRRPSYRLSTIGFGILTLGGVVEPLYQLGYSGDYQISGRELLALQTMEGAFVAIGLGLLFYSIYIHRSGSRSERVEQLDPASE